MRIKSVLHLMFVLLLLIVIFSVCAEKATQYTNSIGMKMMLIPGGTFMMGEHQRIPVQVA